MKLVGDATWDQPGNHLAGKIEHAFDRGDNYFAECNWPLESQPYRITIFKDSRPGVWEKGRQEAGAIKHVRIVKANKRVTVSGLWIEQRGEWQFSMTLIPSGD